MQDLLKVNSEEQGNLAGLSGELRRYANSFGLTGNSTMSDLLGAIADDLDGSANRIDKAITAELNGQYKQSLQSSANVLNAALAGIKVARSKDKTKRKTR